MGTINVYEVDCFGRRLVDKIKNSNDFDIFIDVNRESVEGKITIASSCDLLGDGNIKRCIKSTIDIETLKCSCNPGLYACRKSFFKESERWVKVCAVNQKYVKNFLEKMKNEKINKKKKFVKHTVLINAVQIEINAFYKDLPGKWKYLRIGFPKEGEAFCEMFPRDGIHELKLYTKHSMISRELYFIYQNEPNPKEEAVGCVCSVSNESQKKAKSYEDDINQWSVVVEYNSKNDFRYITNNSSKYRYAHIIPAEVIKSKLKNFEEE